MLRRHKEWWTIFRTSRQGLSIDTLLKGVQELVNRPYSKKIAAAAESRGFDVEMYHCGFDPESIDMVLVRELKFCVFDSTNPHEYFRKGKATKSLTSMN